MPTKNKSETSQTSTLNPWSQQQYQALAGQIQGKVNQPFQAYTGPMAAGLNPLQTAAVANAQGNLGLGQDAVHAGADAARGMLSFASQSVSAPTATTAQLAPSATYSGQGYNASSAQAAQAGAPALTAAQGYAAAQTAPVTAGRAARARSQGYGAQDAARTTLGPTAQADAAQVDRGQVGNVGAGMLDPSRIAALTNPYTDNVINAGVADLNNARKMTINNAQGDFTRAGAFGGTREGVADSLTNDAFLKNVASLSSNLRQQGYDSAANLAQGEAQRGQTAQQSNQSADLTSQTTNASLRNAADQNNAQAKNATNLAQGQLDQSAAQANQSAANNAAQFGAGAANTASLANAQAQTQNNQFNAGMLAQIGQANTAAANAANAFGAGAANNAASQNAQAQNQGAQFDAAQQQAVNLRNAEAADTAARQGADATNTASAANAQAQNARSLTQGQLDQQTALTNAENALKADQGNQGADLTAGNLRNGAAGMMGNLGQSLQTMGLNDTNSLAALGLTGQQTDQAALTAAYQEFLRQQQYPLQQAGMLSGLLGATPMLQNTNGTTTQTQGVNPMQIIGTAAQMAAMMSDRRLKTDVEPVSTDPKGRRWYAFRYLWDRPSVRRLGVMAQEILASDPHAVLTHPSGFLMVDYGALA